MADVIEVVIQRQEAEPIGLNITGGYELKAGGIYVHSVRPESLCDGKLKPDDEIRQINDVIFNDSSERMDAVAAVSSSVGPLKVKVWRQPHSGMLIKQGAKTKNWKKRHFLVKSGVLSYYHPGKYQKENVAPLGTINLGNVSKILPYANDTFRDMFGFQLETPNRTYYMFSETSEDRSAWIEALTPLINQGPPAGGNIPDTEEDDLDDEDVAAADDEVMGIDDAARKMARTSLRSKAVEGRLWKSSPKFDNWTSRWFVLENNVLTYYKDQNGKKLNSIIIGPGCSVRNTPTGDTRVKKGEQFAFTLFDAQKSRDFICCAKSEKDRNMWTEALRAAISA